MSRHDRQPATPPSCPKCKGKLIPIAYGYPSEEMFREAQEGRIALGGCIISGNNPEWRCNACGHEFRSIDWDD